MPQGNSAVRPTNGLYLYIFTGLVTKKIPYCISVVAVSRNVPCKDTPRINAISDTQFLNKLKIEINNIFCKFFPNFSFCGY